MIISIIIPIYNCDDYLEESFNSIINQDIFNYEEEEILIEISIFIDGESKDTLSILDKWKIIFNEKNVIFKCSKNLENKPKGVGFSRNRAIEQSTGEFLCFFDADDIMKNKRILSQYLIAKDNHDALIGSQVVRFPEDSTKLFVKWANEISDDQLYTQIYQAFGPTILMPTWFCHKSVFDRVGAFNERGDGIPEDLIFFYSHLDKDGKVKRVNETLMIYRYHQNATTFSVKEETILHLRNTRFQNLILSKWEHFSIWNAGKSGKRFFRSLSEENKLKVKSFFDVDQNKIDKFYNYYDKNTNKVKPFPIFHCSKILPPFVICIKIELILDSDGPFRKILDKLNFIEGLDYFYFN